MAHTIRTAVSLILAISMAMQPAFLHGGRQECLTDCASNFACQGCGSCHVLSGAGMCSCCNNKPSDRSEHHECGVHEGQHSQAHISRSDDGDQLQGKLLQVASPPEKTTDEQQPFQTDDRPVVKAATPSLAATCRCVTSPRPQEAPVSRSPINELTDNLTHNISVCAAADAMNMPPWVSSMANVHPVVTPHFSQIALCVWRL